MRPLGEDNVLRSSGHRGESHLWDSGVRVAVDLGERTSSGREVGQFAPEILILTHSDADHIGYRGGRTPSVAARAFFSELPAAHSWELWVPYEWEALLSAARDYGDDPGARDGELAEVSALQGEIARLSAEWRTTDAQSPREGGIDPEREERSDEYWSEVEGRLGEALATDELAARIVEEYEGDIPFSQLAFGEVEAEDWRAVAGDVFAKRAKLDYIIREALNHGATIRHFSVDHVDPALQPPWQRSGRPGVATMVNAARVEPVPPTLTRPPTTAGMLFARAILTMQNQRALVSHLHGQSATGALVWSDTDGANCRLDDRAWVPWDEVGVMTAPHHASHKEVHDPIWEARARFVPDLPVVKAGGNHHQTSSYLFLGVPPASRACTLCQAPYGRSPRSGRAVQVFLSAGGATIVDPCQ